jgi:excinuclease ABC subunit B
MMGRAARHRTGRVILYADDVTGSMRRAIEETDRRRAKQLEYNEKMGITPVSISKSLDSLNVFTTDPLEEELFTDEEMKDMSPDARGLLVDSLRREMDEAASALDFERAAWLRDRIEALEGKRAARKGRKGRR